MQPSGLATLSNRSVLTLNAGLLSVVAYPFANGGTLLAFAAPVAGVYTYVNSPTTAFPGGPGLQALAEEGRVVAYGIRVVSLDNANNNQGLITLGCLPRPQVANTSDPTITADGFPNRPTTTATQGQQQFNNYLQTETYPLKDGASAFWRPQDPLDFTFRDAPIVSGAGGGNLLAGVDLSPFFVIGIQGAATNANILIEQVLHIEYTVSSGVLGVISTGTGDMSSQDVTSVVKTVFSDAVDTTMAGVTGGFQKALTAGTQAVGRALRSGLSSAAKAAATYYGATNML